MRFNSSLRVPRALSIVAVIALVPMAAMTANRGEEARAPQAAPAAAKPEVEPGASQSQGIARLRGAWWIARGLTQALWADFDPNTIPVLMVERRPGRPSWALLMHHPSPPAGFKVAAVEAADAPEVRAGAAPSIPAGDLTMTKIGGAATALYLVGETIPDRVTGSPASEEILSAIIHSMAQVYLSSKGYAAVPAKASAAAAAVPAEALALGVVEGRLLTQFLFGDSTKSASLEEVARQFLAVRRTRWAMMGAASDAERKLELWHGLPIYAESLGIRMMAQRAMEPPPLQGDPAYHAYLFNVLWRMNLIISHLLDTPEEAGDLLDRSPYTGAAQCMMLDRLGVEGWSKQVKPDGSLLDVIESKVSLDPAQQEEALTRAKAAYAYDPALALIRERQKK